MTILKRFKDKTFKPKNFCSLHLISSLYEISGDLESNTIGNCQRLAFTVGVSQHMHKITNLSSIGHRTCEIIMIKNKHTKLCAVRWLISRPQVLNLRSRNQIRGKLLLSRKLCHFRGSRFSRCFIPSTSPHYSLPRKVLC